MTTTATPGPAPGGSLFKVNRESVAMTTGANDWWVLALLFGGGPLAVLGGIAVVVLRPASTWVRRSLAGFITIGVLDVLVALRVLLGSGF